MRKERRRGRGMDPEDRTRLYRRKEATGPEEQLEKMMVQVGSTPYGMNRPCVELVVREAGQGEMTGEWLNSVQVESLVKGLHCQSRM